MTDAIRRRWQCECGMRWTTEADQYSYGVSRCPRCGSDQIAVDPPLEIKTTTRDRAQIREGEDGA